MAGLESGDILGSSGFSAQGLLGGLDVVTTVVIYCLIAVLVGSILFACLYLLSFKYPVRIYQQTSGGWVYLDTKARQFKTKDGITKWRFLKWIKESHPAPNNDLLFINAKGKNSAECIRHMDGKVNWVKRDLNGVKPTTLTGEEMAMTVGEIRRSQEYLKQSNMDKILALAPIVFTLIIMILLFAFWGEITKSSNEVAAQLSSSSDRLAVASDRLADAYAKAYPEIVPKNSSSQGLKPGDVITPN